jgi:NTE family protein
VSKVGLVLGGGGVTGAAYLFGTLMALQAATDWQPNDAEVIVGTSSGAFVAALVRGEAMDLQAMADDGLAGKDLEEWLRDRIYRRVRPRGVMRWLTKGIVPGVTNPGLGLVLGTPGLYSTDPLAEWIDGSLGPLAHEWPSEPTVIVGYDLESRRRVPFGTESAPEVPLREAVAASSAVPFIYEPVEIDGRWYVDGGVASGTSVDFVLGNPEPLDLVVVIAPMAATTARPGGRFYEDFMDRAGRGTLATELDLLRRTWPETEVLVLRPDDRVLAVCRPNLMSVDAAVPTFLATLRSMRDELAHPSTWRVLSDHIVGGGGRKSTNGAQGEQEP